MSFPSPPIHYLSPSGANQTHDAPVKPLQAALLPSPSIVALVVKNPPASTGGKRHGLDPWVRTIPWRRPGQPTPVFLPGESHGWRSLVGCSPRGYRVGHDWNNLAHVMVWARKHFLKILNWETNMCYVPLISSYFSSPHNNIFSTFIHCFILHLTFSYLCPFPLDYKFFKANQVQYEILGWSKHSFWFFCNILRKKPNSFCCQPNISLYYVTRLRDEKGRKRRKIAVRESLYDVR